MCKQMSQGASQLWTSLQTRVQTCKDEVKARRLNLFNDNHSLKLHWKANELNFYNGELQKLSEMHKSLESILGKLSETSKKLGVAYPSMSAGDQKAVKVRRKKENKRKAKSKALKTVKKTQLTNLLS